MGWFGKKKDNDEALLGKWIIDPEDPASIAAFGNVSMSFDGDGNLIYVIHIDGSDQIMLMTFRVDGDCIVTNQPSHPKEERSKYSMSADGVLNLSFGGESARFIRS